MAGGQDDSAPARRPVPPLPSYPPTARPAASPREPVLEEPRAADGHRWLAGGLVLAAAGIVPVLCTDISMYLQLALLCLCWAFVVAGLFVGGRRADQVAAAGRESELRHAYELELEREVTARQEYEVALERRLRQETQEAMRVDLAQMRAGLAELRAGLAAMAQLPTELAARGATRSELAGLGGLSAEVAGLRDDLDRLRTELSERLSGELRGAPAGYSAADEPAPHRGPDSPGHARLTEILADGGVETSRSGRPRRPRHRDEDGATAADDVLARVLGRA